MEIKPFHLILCFLAVPAIHFLALATGGYSCEAGQGCLIWMDNLSHAFAGGFAALLWLFFEQKKSSRRMPLTDFTYIMSFVLGLSLLWELLEWGIFMLFTDFAYSLSLYSPSLAEASMDVFSNLLGGLVLALLHLHLKSQNR